MTVVYANSTHINIPESGHLAVGPGKRRVGRWLLVNNQTISMSAYEAKGTIV